ncbi:LacI family DNA-binding transcriptional regulator [Chthonobacter rhizosphaerae]|uniref:LacI family DNA-binding transcriptional regulator n=1 Tax=Chthonobacter rhizosphaerae TaxID=2735553 RepID=UPI0015EE6896|nr:LacI family DNA-binding transcriptional regulator [Chthonobacter rhizosphaerae]
MPTSRRSAKTPPRTPAAAAGRRTPTDAPNGTPADPAARPRSRSATDGSGRPALPKIADVAARAGVSTATVSRALAAPDSVSPDKRERVLAAVRELGYTPNAAARNLRAGRTSMVLVVVPKLANPFFNGVVRGADEALTAEGFGMIIGDLDNTADKEHRLVDIALAGHIDGALILSGRVPRHGARTMKQAGIPMVGVCVASDDPQIPAVLIDDAAAARTQVEHLVGLGHRRLLYVSGPRGNGNEIARWRGFTEAAAAAGLGAEAIQRAEGDYTFAAGTRAADLFLALPAERRPTGVVAVSDEMALAFIRRVAEAGVRVPGDVSVVGFDGIEVGDYCAPRLTTIRQPSRDMGREAARLLVAAIRGEPSPPGARVLGAELKVAESTGAPPRR